MPQYEMAKKEANVDCGCIGDACPAYSVSQIIHTLIGLAIMFFGRYLPAPSLAVESSQRLVDMGFPIVDGLAIISVSQHGMTAFTLFLGIVYLWSTVDTFWPSVLGILALGMSEFGPMNKVLGQFLQNPMAISILFLMFFAAALVHSNISRYLARWLITRPALRGKPWLLTTMLLLTCYLVACIEQVSAVFLMWPVLYVLFEVAGYKKTDSYVTVMMANSIIMILLSFASDPLKGGAFYLLSNLYSVAGASPELNVQPIDFASYLGFSFAVSFVSLLLIVATMRYIFRVDVSKLKNINLDEFNRNPLPPMNWQQKGVIVIFGVFVLWMLLPGILGNDSTIGRFFAQNMMAGSAVGVFLLTFINFKSKPIAALKDFAPKFPWGVYILIAVALFMGGVLLQPVTNIVIFMEYALRLALEGLSYTALVAAVCCLGLLVTNICNSVAAGVLFTPILLAMCAALGVDARPLLACFFFIVLIAAVTPAGSPFAALLFENKEWISAKDAFKYTAISSILILLALLFVGVPLATIMF